ncbi:MAG: tellurite resistance TerB family protein [Opitutales bacterium]
MPIDKLFNQMLSSPSAKGALSGAASGALVSALLNKKARKGLVGGAAKVGGLAALAGVGYLAYKKWQDHKGRPEAVQPASAPGNGTDAQRPAAAPLSLEAASTSAPAVSNETGVRMLQAMIGAASADGHIDQAEMQQLMEAIDQAGLSADENAAITASLNQPPTAEAIAEGVTDPEVAAEIYGAAAMAIERDTPAEELFLNRLARLLKLDPQLVALVDNSAAEA